MIFIISVVTANVFFLGCLHLAYLVVARRRWKIYLLVEHLATLTRNGMPLHAGLRVIGRDLGGFLGLQVARVARSMEEGRLLGDAFEAAPGTFPPLLRSMLALGEKCGNLSGFLEEMRRSYRRIADLPFQSMYLFLYPLLLSVGINMALAGLYVAIVPKFETIFQQMRADPSAIMLWGPRLIAANEAILILCVAMVVFLAMGGTSMHFRTTPFRFLKRGMDRIVLALPVIGGLVRDGAVQQFALCSGLFLRSGAVLPEALAAAAAAERNDLLRHRLERVARAVSEGSRLSSAAREDGKFGEDLLWFLETGEASGLLSEHLLLAAVHYETKVRLAARLASRGVVPLFVLLNGAIVFGTFLLIFVPLTEILRLTVEGRP